MSKKSIDPDVFSKVLGTDSSIAQGHQVGAIEHIKLFPAPWGKCSSLLTDGTLNNCFITVYLILFHTLYIISVSGYFEPCQARIQEFTLVGAPWIGEGSGDRQGPQRV